MKKTMSVTMIAAIILLIITSCRQEPNIVDPQSVLIPADAEMVFTIDINKIRESLLVQNILLSGQSGYMDELRKDILQLDPYYIESIYGYVDDPEGLRPTLAFQFNIKDGFGYPFAEYLTKGNRPTRISSGPYIYYSLNGSSSKQMFVFPSENIVLVAGSEETMERMIGVAQGARSYSQAEKELFRTLDSHKTDFSFQLTGKNEEWIDFAIEMLGMDGSIDANMVKGCGLGLDVSEKQIAAEFRFTADGSNNAELIQLALSSLEAESFIEQADFLEEFPSFMRQLSNPEETRITIIRNDRNLTAEIELELSQWQSTFIGADRYLNSLLNRKPKTLKKQLNIPFIYIFGPLLLPFLIIIIIFLIKEQKKKQLMVGSGMTAGTFEDELKSLKKKQGDLSKIPRNHFTAEMRQSLNSITVSLDKILNTLKTHPERFTRVRRQLQYYLDTAMKILEQYNFIQTHETENKTELTAKISDSLDNLEFGFKEMLKALISDTVLDLDAEMKVLDMRINSDFDTSENTD